MTKKVAVNGASQLPAAIANMATGLAASATSVSDGSNFMKFTKFGEFLYGADSIEVEPESDWAVNPMGFGQGWIAWGDKAHGTDGKMLGETMVGAGEAMPPQPAPVEGAWAEQRALQLACATGEDKGTQCLFKTSSHGGKKAYAALVLQVVKKIQAGESDIVPVVKLTADSYTHPTYGKIFTPTFEVVSWTTMEATEAPAEETQEEEQEPEVAKKPARRRRAKA